MKRGAVASATTPASQWLALQIEGDGYRNGSAVARGCLAGVHETRFWPSGGHGLGAGAGEEKQGFQDRVLKPEIVTSGKR